MTQYVVDDAGAGRRLGADPHAIVREAGADFRYASRIVDVAGVLVAAHSYLDVALTDKEAAELALDYLVEIGKATPSSACTIR